MRWPWQKQKREHARLAAAISPTRLFRLIEAQAAGTAADASSTAAVEAASGALSRAFASAEVVGEPWVAGSGNAWSSWRKIGRDLVRSAATQCT